MKTQIKLLILTIAMAFLFNSCFFGVYEIGNGDVIEETRNIPEFTEISSSGSFNIYYEFAEETELTISGESNLLPYIETVVFDNELKIRTAFNVNINPHKTIEIYVKGPYIDRIHLSGSGLIYTDSIFNDRLELSTSGSGDIETKFFGDELYTKLSGSGKIEVSCECQFVETIISGSGSAYLEGIADDASYRISGSGKVKAYDLETLRSDVSISGSGDLFLNVSNKLDVAISGSGNVHYIGFPSVNSHSSGSGEIINEN